VKKKLVETEEYVCQCEDEEDADSYFYSGNEIFGGAGSNPEANTLIILNSNMGGEPKFDIVKLKKPEEWKLLKWFEINELIIFI